MDLYTELYTLLKNYDLGTAPDMSQKSIVVIPPKQAVLYKLAQSKNWYVRVKYNDQPGYWKKSTGTPNFEQAKAKAIEWHMLINSENKEVGNIFRSKSLTIKDVANEFLKKKSSNNNDQSIVENHINPKIGHIAIQRLKYADLENYIIECGIKSKSTFDNHKATLLKLFRFSIQRQYIESSDHLSINHNDFKHNFEKVERDDISPNEFKVIGDNFENWIDKARTKRAKKGRRMLFFYIHILLFSGIRPGKELSEVELQHINLQIKNFYGMGLYVDYKASLKITSGKVSKKHKREIPLASDCVVALTGAIQAKMNMEEAQDIPTNYVKNNSEKLFYIEDFLPDYSKMFGNYISELKEEGKINNERNITLYSFRHTYITNELKQKRDIYTIAKYCGTSVKMIEDHYAKNKSMIDEEEYEDKFFNPDYFK